MYHGPKIEWQPTEDRLSQILQLLRDTQSPYTAIQREVQEKLLELNEDSDFNNDLMFVLTKLKQEGDPTRSLSGLILKNNIRSNYKTIQPWVWTFVKQECLNSIGDESVLIRATICIIIRTILERMGFHFWPELLPTLCEFLDSREYKVSEGASSALKVVCEDAFEEQERDAPRRGMDHILNVLIPKFLHNFKEASPKMRSDALENVKQLKDVTELVTKFSSAKHSVFLFDTKKTDVKATKGKQFTPFTKETKVRKTAKLTKASKSAEEKWKLKKREKNGTDKKTMKQAIPKKKMRRKARKKTPLKSFTKKKLLREKINDAKFLTGPLKKLNWSDWYLSICHRIPPSIANQNFKKSSVFGAYHRNNLFDRDANTPAVYEIGVKEHAKLKTKKHAMYLRICRGYSGNKSLILYLLHSKKIRQEVKRLLGDKFEIHIRRGVVKSGANASVTGVGGYLRDIYDYAWFRHGKKGHRKVSRVGTLLSDPAL